MRHFSNILFLLFFVMLFFSCESQEEQQAFGTIYGTVLDNRNPIVNASVELRPIGRQTVTGEDGTFDFPDLMEGTYNLSVTKTGYKEYISENIIVKGKDVKIKADVPLEKLPPALTIVDDNGQKIDSLVFDSDEGTTMRSFTIFNNGDDKLKWTLAYNCNWIKSFSTTNGDIKANDTETIRIYIDRDKLNLGKNTTIIQIGSNNGSKELTIIAYKVNFVETKDATDIGAQTAVLNAYIVRDMHPSITEYGFVYSRTPAPSLTNKALKVSNKGTPTIGGYSLLINNLERENKYYFLAFVSNGTEVIYGEQKNFTTISHTPDISISISSITATTITVAYRVYDAGIPLQEVGLCWSTNPLPTHEDNYKKFGEEAKSYTSVIEGLDVCTKYYIRVYAKNADGDYYSTERETTTNDGRPKVSTSAEYKNGSDYLVLSGSATSESDMPILKQGICYSTIPNPTIDDNTAEASLNSVSFSCKIDGLQQGTTYYYRAFAENKYGTAYGGEQSCSTTYRPAILKGYVYDQNDTPIQDAYVDGYDVSGYTTTTDATGYYEISFNLKRTTTYQFRAYKNGYDDKIKQVTLFPGETTQQDFSLLADTPQLPTEETGSYITMPDGSFMVQTVDLGSAQWHSANTLCTNSTLGGYTDWRLPTLEELKKIYTHRTQIGGFPSRAVNSNQYWSADPYPSKSGYYYYVDFNTGEANYTPRVNSFKVRAVRTIK